jgi:hypothetical protein
MRKITIKTSQNIARKVIQFMNSAVGQRTYNLEAQIDWHLKDIGLGWKLKEGTYIDGVSIQSIKELANDIRNNAIERF